MKLFAALALMLNSFNVCGQNLGINIVGKYADEVSELTLNQDSTFELNTLDYVYPFTSETYQNKGKWTGSGNVIILNPTKMRRVPIVVMTEKSIVHFDSIRIKINYQTEIFENETRQEIIAADFSFLSLYINKHSNYQNFVHKTINGASASVYALSLKEKKPVTIDSTNTITLPKQVVKRFGIYTYGFNKTIELEPSNPLSNDFEITITQPIDKERMPRNKKVIIKENHAYFYELNGKVPTSGLLLNWLKLIR